MFENKIKITAPFWQQYINLIREEMLPFQWSVLNDEADIKIEKERDADHIPAEKSHAIENFKIAASFFLLNLKEYYFHFVHIYDKKALE